MSVESAPIPSTLSQIQRSSAHSELQAIHADYYNITNANGAPLGGLLVLLDRKQRPVRAELHLNESTGGPMHELALRQAYLLIEDRYTGTQPIRLNVLRSFLEQEPLLIPLDAPPPPSNVPVWLKPLLLGVLALVVFGGAGWYLNDLLTGSTVVASVPQAPAVVEEATTAQVDMPVATTETTESVAPVSEEEERIFQTNGLPASRNALPLEVGQRVRIRPGYQVALRTEPGADAGEVTGSILGGTEALVINGPVWMEGNSDTIVWWKVRLDDGSVAWVAANTSDLTLLEPVP